MDSPSMAGLAGALLAGYAYLPQIAHLIRERCSAGISRSAFSLWFVSSLLITYSALATHSMVFSVLGFIQISATAVIWIYSTKYRNLACPSHAGL